MLSYLVDIVAEIQHRIRTAERTFLFLDFDGTLAPIEADFAAVSLDPGIVQVLAALSAQPSLVITIISGRAVDDLLRRVGLQSLLYAGNQGLEIRGRDLHFVEPLSEARRTRLERLANEIAARLSPIAGAAVECKGLSASVHYRQAAESDYNRIQDSVKTAVSRDATMFRLIHGLKTIDILPRTNWHKGAAARWIINRFGGAQALTIYLGDDAADEEAFLFLPDAVNIKVGGAQPTRARYRLPHPAAVHEFLRWLATLWEPRTLPA